MRGQSFVSLDIAELPIAVADLREKLNNEQPNLRFVLMNSLFALNNRLVPRSAEKNHKVEGDSEIVLVPPVSGG
jgi:molybdopterin converting factor small subunit